MVVVLVVVCIFIYLIFFLTAIMLTTTCKHVSHVQGLFCMQDAIRACLESHDTTYVKIVLLIATWDVVQS
jgi:hypothetical protein